MGGADAIIQATAAVCTPRVWGKMYANPAMTPTLGFHVHRALLLMPSTFPSGCFFFFHPGADLESEGREGRSIFLPA